MPASPERYSKLAFLKDIDPAELPGIVGRMHQRSLPRRAVIFRQGEPSTHAYIIVSGEVRISVLSANGNEMTLDVLHAGDLFGIAGLVHDLPRVSNAVAARATTVLEIPTAVLSSLMDTHPAIYRDLLEQLLRRLTRSIQEQVSTGTQRVYGRVAAKLLVLAEHDSSHGGDEARLPAGLSHQDLASMIGSTRATVSRILQDMRKQGILDVDSHGRQIVILEASRLAEYTEASMPEAGHGGTVFP